MGDTPYLVGVVALRADGTAMLVGRQASFEGGSFVAVEQLRAGGSHDDDFAFEPDINSFLAPTSAGGDSYSTKFVAALCDDSRPMLLAPPPTATAKARISTP